MKRNYLREIGLTLAVYAAAAAAAWGLGFRMRIHYEYGHLLNRELLEWALGESLWNLHAQPPAMNLILGVLLAV